MIQTKLVATLVTALLLGLVPADAAERVALLIGNASYQNFPSLRTPAKDVAAIAAALRAEKYEVLEHHDLGVISFKRALREFATLAKSAEIAMIYYAGYGMEMNGVNYLIPVDAKLRSDYDAEDEAVALARLQISVESAKRLRLFILDASRDNPFSRTRHLAGTTQPIKSDQADPGTTQPIKSDQADPISSTFDTLFVYAAKTGATSSDGSGQNSPFAAALLKHITTPNLDVQFIFRRVRDDVLRATGGQQEPFMYGSLGAREIFLVDMPGQK